MTDDLLAGLKELLARHGLRLCYVTPVQETRDGTRSLLSRRGRYELQSVNDEGEDS
ncbi:hypothetical protein [Chelativorans sp. YIM 93263]|uniref:hypothetical protein n=1 Tax=Chelativorans sp. YIM 93263 TaxID=2906648 RepID=UPI002379F1ED|nr:hypothetical protein [Chelativorans sp. YIM 93263]